MSRSSLLTLRLDPATKKRLDDVAKSTQRTRALVAAQAVHDFLEVNDWQVREIEKGVQEADNGEFATDEEVKRVTTKWSNRAG